jgi:hypothetical protein
LVGYGLVVGLDGTGDQTSQTPFTIQTVRNMLLQMGVTTPELSNPQLKNVAAVMVHASLPPFAKPGATIDVTVSSIGNAKSLREEFAAYGLPFWFMCVVGVLKVGLALALIAAIWIHGVAHPAAIGLGVLMLGAFGMHLKVKDPIQKALPSIAVLAMCAAIALL